MPMNHRLLRPLRAVVAAVTTLYLRTIGGDNVTTQGGDRLRAIQNG